MGAIIRNCRKCLDEDRHLARIATYQSYAQIFNGTIVSEVVTDMNTPHLWQCQNGHIFSKKPKMVEEGYWCQDCKKHKTKAAARNQANQKI